ncbi:MAG: hypothetical protein HC896_10015 [Bacteroidales bacterium]|nr:hypothetical protein [Bacteroidales bacterium]
MLWLYTIWHVGDVYSFMLFNRHYPYFGYFICVYMPKFLLLALLLVSLLVRGAESLLAGTAVAHVWATMGSLAIYAVLSGFLWFGFIYGRFLITTTHTNIETQKHLPRGSLKIVHISDFHIGSLVKQKWYVKKVVREINALNPDFILFTGDMVNNLSAELQPFTAMLAGLKSKHGNYAIMGNHDYAEYAPFASAEEQQADILKLHKLYGQTGFKLLLNENVFVDSLNVTIVGVENWGLPPFKQYGNLQKLCH